MTNRHRFENRAPAKVESQEEVNANSDGWGDEVIEEYATNPAAQPANANDEFLKFALARLAQKTEGEARALVEVVTCRLGFGHAADLKLPRAETQIEVLEARNAELESLLRAEDYTFEGRAKVRAALAATSRMQK